MLKIVWRFIQAVPDRMLLLDGYQEQARQDSFMQGMSGAERWCHHVIDTPTLDPTGTETCHRNRSTPPFSSR